MKERFLSCVLLISCTLFVTIFSFEDFPTSKIEDFNLSGPRFGEQLNVRGASENVTNGLLFEETERRRELNGNEEIIDSVKSKGKGTNGGGNVDHHPGSKKSGASLIASPCHLISAAVLQLSLTLMELLLSYLLTGF